MEEWARLPSALRIYNKMIIYIPTVASLLLMMLHEPERTQHDFQIPGGVSMAGSWKPQAKSSDGVNQHLLQ